MDKKCSEVFNLSEELLDDDDFRGDDIEEKFEELIEEEQSEERVECDGEDSTDNKCKFAELPITASPDVPAEPNLALLPHDHPLMQNFQRLLKEHLLRTKTEITEQLALIKHEIKMKEQLHEDAGLKLYDMQEDLKQQEIQIHEFEQEVKEHQTLREAEEAVIDKLQNELNDKMEHGKELKQQYKRRMMELEHVNELENNTRKWVDELEDSVKNAKRVVDRDAQMQQQLNDDKSRSDILFFRLDLEVKKCEKELAVVKEEQSDMRDVKEVLSMSLANANSDLTVLQNEHKRLTQSWGEVIVAISHRDKIMHELQQAIEKENQQIKNHESSIQGSKKQIKQELKENEKLQQFKMRFANDFHTIKLECTKLSQVLTNLERKLEELPLYLAETEKELHEAKKEGNFIETELNRVLWRIEKHSRKKFELEEGILKVVQDQLIADKASKYRIKLLRTTQEQRRNMELNVSHAENQLAEALLDIEVVKGEITRLQHEQDQFKTKLNAIEQKYDNANEELKSLETQIDLKLRRMEKLNKDIDDIKQSFEEVVGSPIERKVLYNNEVHFLYILRISIS